MSKFVRGLLAGLVGWIVENELGNMILWFDHTEVESLPLGRSVKVTFTYEQENK